MHKNCSRHNRSSVFLAKKSFLLQHKFINWKDIIINALYRNVLENKTKFLVELPTLSDVCIEKKASLDRKFEAVPFGGSTVVPTPFLFFFDSLQWTAKNNIIKKSPHPFVIYCNTKVDVAISTIIMVIVSTPACQLLARFVVAVVYNWWLLSRYKWSPEGSPEECLSFDGLQMVSL